MQKLFPRSPKSATCFRLTIIRQCKLFTCIAQFQSVCYRMLDYYHCPLSHISQRFTYFTFQQFLFPEAFSYVNVGREQWKNNDWTYISESNRNVKRCLVTKEKEVALCHVQQEKCGRKHLMRIHLLTTKAAAAKPVTVLHSLALRLSALELCQC